MLLHYAVRVCDTVLLLLAEIFRMGFMIYLEATSDGSVNSHLLWYSEHLGGTSSGVNIEKKTKKPNAFYFLSQHVDVYTEGIAGMCQWKRSGRFSLKMNFGE